MDAFLAAAPNLGVGGIAIALAIIVIRLFLSSDKRADSVQDKAMTDLRTDVDKLRAEVASLRAEVEAERTLRRAAEEALHQYKLTGSAPHG
jgi:outer membrane murein-binding lipoprotein Lpp